MQNNKKSWLILIAVGLFTFMSTLDSSIINIALPTISKELNIPMNEATWSVSIYLIAVSGLLIFFGRLGDIFGKIKVFKIGTVIFTLGSLLAGFNFGIYFLLFSRFIQAIGAAMTMSNSFGITTESFPLQLRARAMSFIGIFVSLGAVTGPGLGGLILQFLPWSYIFWINVPIGIFAILMGQKLFPKAKPIEQVPPIDYLGTILFFFSIVSIFLGIEIGQVQGFANLITISLLIIGLILLIIFIIQENRIKIPLIELKIFKNQLFSISLISALLIFTTNFFANIIMPFYLQNYLGWDPGFAGLVLMAFPATMLIFSPIGGYLGDYFNKEKITAIGIAIVVIAQLCYTTLDYHSSFILIVGITALNAMGSTLFQSSNNALVMSSVDKQYFGVAGSINALARNLGMISGISIATITLFTSMSRQAGKHVTDYLPEHPEYFLNGMHLAFYISSILALITLCLVSYRLFKLKK
ncbi:MULTISPECIES: MFS transporter [unclassified Enterococcus]|uniref:MFS transporter n=1 Tax=unclassified Enterococcus TaxID=2608891 RepID=UPI0015551CF1|nr:MULTISPECIES: MFS transporter [unclassified Enterococcus]MBS7575963.1 MFS transporter [Enterococcus sp. MMGLQ5-2]MBS7583196.1 MFS transporter [Enterococcus sp. MMGLQ5-1]NPD11056.1 MFS transporter [Enterococcus sp. MMGLQ5-1]NPD35799.1 MFS transporter [Enterococcus sp. MMGLQ5-2]